MKDLMALINNLKRSDNVYIQTHNFPDHDAVASAFALQYLLRNYNIKTSIIYEGEIQRDSLRLMIEGLHIDIKHAGAYELKESDKIIIVDGCKGNKNVTDLIGEEVAVIDHHQVKVTEDVAYVDIRPEYGACSTIIFSYYILLKQDMPKDVATALLIGLNMDTALLTRGVSEEDIGAYSYLYSYANSKMVNSILRNYIQQKDLRFYKEAIDNLKIIDKVGFCYFPDGCNQNLLGIIGDFFLSLREVDFMVLAANNENNINLSVRSERDDWNAARVIQKVLSGIGFGGGHSDMAGGIIKNYERFDFDALIKRFLDALDVNASPAY
ncbi:MAG TPA: DHHA1 domain-containing protein [Spirochaetota bacterium]|nr:DHHA1 domain-containing protein [Spirochaetota bacterium]HOS31821.1 DHHA1 domain-containing protein [Spirochaetota bacterium]HOS55775.1 DHHA1 domain-containing protein [Spirochaetota bacterium]HPK63073.1 DHHA1 domain-containing protein [Spirochaetota bacterium]HQF76713.1 DHHA1 domain-containing protein [Spirochaetota bacterium]